jgi:hypothetical protein
VRQYSYGKLTDALQVYIGFGSITIEDPAALSRLVADSVTKAGLRAILVCSSMSFFFSVLFHIYP